MKDYLYKLNLATIAMALLMLALLVFSYGCAVCTAQSTRCEGHEAQICDSRGHWRSMMDCDQVNGDVTFSCQETMDGDEVGHTCLPEPEEGSSEGTGD